MSTYNAESEIGDKKALKVETVQLGFQIERDWEMISNYLIGQS